MLKLKQMISKNRTLSAIIALAILSVLPSANAQFAQEQWTDAQRKVIAYVPIGDQKIDPKRNPRGVSPTLYNNGTYSSDNLKNRLLTELYQKGFRRFVLWECFGRMQAVQTWKFTRHGCPCSYQTVLSITDWLDLQSLAKTFTPYADMVTTFVPTIQSFKQAHPDVEIFCYVGTSMGCPAIESLPPAQIPAKLQQCLQPYLDAGVDGLIFDSASGIPPDHWMVDCFNRLQKLGIKVFVEAAPSNYPYQVKTGFFSSLEQFANAQKQGFAYTVPSTANGANVGFLNPAMVEGERIGFEAAAKPAKYPTTRAWLQDVVPAALKSGQLDSVCLASSWFVNDPSMMEIKLEEFWSLVGVVGQKD
jgi:hypothetical protein